MTYKEKIIATAYTGIMFVDGSQLGELYAYEEEKLGYGVIDIMHADKDFCMKVRNACKDDFIAMLKGDGISRKDLESKLNGFAAAVLDAETCTQEFVEFWADRILGTTNKD